MLGLPVRRTHPGAPRRRRTRPPHRPDRAPQSRGPCRADRDGRRRRGGDPDRRVGPAGRRARRRPHAGGRWSPRGPRDLSCLSRHPGHRPLGIRGPEERPGDAQGRRRGLPRQRHGGRRARPGDRERGPRRHQPLGRGHERSRRGARDPAPPPGDRTGNRSSPPRRDRAIRFRTRRVDGVPPDRGPRDPRGDRRGSARPVRVDPGEAAGSSGSPRRPPSSSGSNSSSGR